MTIPLDSISKLVESIEEIPNSKTNPLSTPESSAPSDWGKSLLLKMPDRYENLITRYILEKARKIAKR